MSDEQRELTATGNKRLARAAPTWSELLDAPDVVVTSPLIRARQTADAFCDAVGFEPPVRVDDGLEPGARPDLALTLLESELLAGTGSVALVGHEPNLGYLLGSLLTANQNVRVPLRKGMLVGLHAGSTTNLVADLRFSLGQKLAGRLR